MTGDEERQRVMADGIANSARGVGMVHLPGQACVTRPLARRQAQERLPDFELEVCPAQVDGQHLAGLG